MKFELTNDIILYLFIGLGVISLFLFVMLMVSLGKIKKLTNKIDAFMRSDSDKKSIEETLILYMDKVEQCLKEKNELSEVVDEINRKTSLSVYKKGFIRYNPFDDVGGDLCFCLALLDDNNDGFIINSIYSREGCYVYGKPVIDGKNHQNYKFSEEETETVKQAIENGEQSI